LTPDDFAQASWADIQPYYDGLAERALTRRNVRFWLRDWAALEAAVGEAIALAANAFSANTIDPRLEAAYQRFAGEIQPRCAEQFVRLGGKLLDLGYEPADLRPSLRNMRNQREIFHEENLPLQQALQPLDAEYQRITGEMSTEWEGERIPLVHLAPFLNDPVRTTRKRAYRKFFGAYASERDRLATIFDEQWRLRQQIARNAGFTTYRDYAFREKNRFDYGVAECLAFHEAVETEVVPALARRLDNHRRQRKTRTVRPWDVRVDPRKRPPLTPFQSTDELIGRTEAMLRSVDPVFGTRFALMQRERLLDLDARPGKAPTGFCTSLLYSERPFIFMNATGTAQDVITLVHETGHAMHIFEIFEHQPPHLRDWPGSEMTELGSMTMELLVGPFLVRQRGGFYSDAEARRAQVEHFQFMLEVLVWIAAVDAFQHWIYTDPAGADRDRRDEEWLKISERFNAGIDWSGLQPERLAQWYQQIHIFTLPFYFIEYAIAQIGALQIWQRSLVDRETAVRDYRRALALGNTRPLPELFATAGARFAFDRATLGEIVRTVEAELARLETEEARS
jgi:oligoendopeptidase F